MLLAAKWCSACYGQWQHFLQHAHSCPGIKEHCLSLVLHHVVAYETEFNRSIMFSLACRWPFMENQQQVFIDSIFDLNLADSQHFQGCLIVGSWQVDRAAESSESRQQSDVISLVHHSGDRLLQANSVPGTCRYSAIRLDSTTASSISAGACYIFWPGQRSARLVSLIRL